MRSLSVPVERIVHRPSCALPALLCSATLLWAAPAAVVGSERLSRREAIAEALARNPALQASREQVAQARARVSQAKALPDPFFSATLEEQESFLKPRSATAKDLGVGFTLPFPTKLRLAGRVATADLRAAEFAMMQLGNETAAQTAQAYDALLVAERHRQDLTAGRGFAEDFLKKTWSWPRRRTR